ncbi:MAG: nicotinate-nucleotide adenylyltransferase [Pseudomonadota bacterium]
MAIGLLGGSFNPPHEGHRLITEIALRRLRLHQLWWVVTPGNPLKSHDGLASLEMRLALSRALVPDNRVTITAFERAMPQPITVATLAVLKRRFPHVRFVWLMGADNLATIHRWHLWRDIFATFPIAVVNRPGFHLKALSAPAAHAFARHRLPEQEAPLLAYKSAPAWVFLTGPLSELSSTQLRDQNNVHTA